MIADVLGPMPVACEIDENDLRREEGCSVLVRGTFQHVDSDTGGFAERSTPNSDSTTNATPGRSSNRSRSTAALCSPQPQRAVHIRGYL